MRARQRVCEAQHASSVESLRVARTLGSGDRSTVSSPTFLGNDDGNALVVGQHQTAVPTPRTHREGVTGSEHQNDCCPTIAPLALDVLGPTGSRSTLRRDTAQRESSPERVQQQHLPSPIIYVKCKN